MYACSWLSLLMICVNTSTPKPGKTTPLLQLAMKLPVPEPSVLCCRYNLCSVTGNVKYNEHIHHLEKALAFKKKRENAAGSTVSFIPTYIKIFCFIAQELPSDSRDLWCTTETI